MHLDDLSAKRLQKLEIQNGALIYTVKTTLLLVQQLAAGHPINPEHLNGLIHSLEVLSDSPNR